MKRVRQGRIAAFPSIAGGLALGLAGFAGQTGGPAAAAVPDDKRPAAAAQPDIVMVLMDDFSMELLETMPEAQKMIDDGASYSQSFVIDSLCCPSRTATFTGQTPSQNGVLTNTPNDPDNPIGGWAAYEKYGNPDRAFNVSLQKAGYHTGFVG